MFVQLLFILIRIHSVNVLSGRLKSMDALQVPIAGHFGKAKTQIGRLMQSYVCLKNKISNCFICLCNCNEEMKIKWQLPSSLTNQLFSAYCSNTESGITTGVGLDNLERCLPASVVLWNYNKVLEGNLFSLGPEGSGTKSVGY